MKYFQNHFDGMHRKISLQRHQIIYMNAVKIGQLHQGVERHGMVAATFYLVQHIGGHTGDPGYGFHGIILKQSLASELYAHKGQYGPQVVLYIHKSDLMYRIRADQKQYVNLCMNFHIK